MDVVGTTASPAACPAAQTLAEFASGRLGDDEMARIAEHLGRCPKCLRAMETPSAPAGDAFVQNLQRIHQEGVTSYSAAMAAEALADEGPYFFNVSKGPPTRDAERFFAVLAESQLFETKE